MNSRCLHTAGLISLFLAGLAAADTMQKLSLPQLAEQADVIVRGRVKELKARSSADGSLLSTRVLVSVEERFKGGDKAVSLAIELPVGALGRIAQGSPGTPEFSPREEVILFLQRERKQESYRLIGGKQGKFVVKSEPGSDRKRVEDLTRHTESYDAFVERLTKALKSQK